MELVFSLLPLLFQMMPVSEAISKLHKANVTMSERLDSLFKRPRYDPRLRPDFNEKPVTVTVGFWVLAIDSINVMDMEIGFDIFLRQTWEDNRLDHGLNDTLSLSNTVLSQIWLPDSYFKNAKHANFHDVTAPNIMITIGPGGLVYYNARVTLKTSCPMDLRLYPMDVQECPLIMESYGYNVNDIVYKWEKSNGDGMSFVPRDMKMLPQFKLTKLHLSTVFTKYVVGDWSGVQAKFTLQRLYSFQVIHLYGPSGLIVALSWLTFFLPSSQSPARVTLGVTSVLTIVTILTMSNNSMPKVNYVKAIDRYLIVCFLFVFCSLLEYAVVLFLEKAKWRFENQMRERKQMLEKLNSHQTTHNETNGRTKQRTSSTIVTLEGHHLTESMNTGYTYTNKPCHRVITSCQGKTQSPNASSTDLSRDTRQSSWHSIQQFIYREAFIVGVDEFSLKLFPFVFLSFNLYYWSTIFFFPQTI